MIEGDNSKPKEIGKTEKNKFEEKVQSLTKLGWHLGSPTGEKDTSALVSLYRKGQESIFVARPGPSYETNPDAEVFAEVTSFLFQVGGKAVIKRKQLVFNPNKVSTSDNPNFVYSEADDLYDKRGNLLLPEQTRKEKLRARRDAAILGENEVTPDRYNDIMRTLDSLTPQDEVID